MNDRQTETERAGVICTLEFFMDEKELTYFDTPDFRIRAYRDFLLPIFEVQHVTRRFSSNPVPARRYGPIALMNVYNGQTLGLAC